MSQSHLAERQNPFVQGPILSALIRFSLPLMLSLLLQALYGGVDLAVVGQFSPTASAAAVATGSQVMQCATVLITGLTMGVTVCLGKAMGARDMDNAAAAVAGQIRLFALVAVILTVVMILFAPQAARWMHVPEEALEETVRYIRICSGGMVFITAYNGISGIFRGVGNSRSPFLFVLIACVVNVVLDLVFVFTLDMCVAGVAYATVIAQAVSAVLTLITLLKTRLCVRINMREMKIDAGLLKKIIKVGIPAALQMALTAFSNVFVQSYISNVDSEQTASLGGWTTYNKIDQFIFLPIQSIALAATTFVGQNLGAGNVERAKKGTYCSYLMATVVSVVLIIPIMLLSEDIAKIFNANEDIVAHASLLLVYMTPFYLFSCVNQVFAAAMRGAGNSTAPMIIMLGCFIGVRQLYLYVVSTFITNKFLPIAFSYPVGWAACCVAILVYYFAFFSFDKNKLLSEKKSAEQENADKTVSL